MSQLKDALKQSSSPATFKRALNIRGGDTGLDTANFAGILSSADDTVQKALDTLDDIFGSSISVTGDGEFISTDAGASFGPLIDLYRNSGSPAANDALGAVVFYGEDSAGNKQEYARVYGRIQDATSGSEDGSFNIFTTVNGTAALRFRFGSGFFYHAVTGGDKGEGTINATAIYDDNVQIKPTEVFRSTGQTITANSAHTFAHGLSAEPDMVTVILQCTTADLNYSIGDRILVSSLYETGVGTDVGVTILVDGTNVVVYVADQIDVLDKSTQEVSPITLASWEMYTKAIYHT